MPLCELSNMPSQPLCPGAAPPDALSHLAGAGKVRELQHLAELRVRRELFLWAEKQHTSHDTAAREALSGHPTQLGPLCDGPRTWV
jgi:hypothetical protein